MNFRDPSEKAEGTRKGAFPIKLLSKSKRRRGKVIRSEALERHLAAEKERADG